MGTEQTKLCCRQSVLGVGAKKWCGFMNEHIVATASAGRSPAETIPAYWTTLAFGEVAGEIAEIVGLLLLGCTHLNHIGQVAAHIPQQTSTSVYLGWGKSYQVT